MSPKEQELYKNLLDDGKGEEAAFYLVLGFLVVLNAVILAPLIIHGSSILTLVFTVLFCSILSFCILRLYEKLTNMR